MKCPESYRRRINLKRAKIKAKNGRRRKLREKREERRKSIRR